MKGIKSSSEGTFKGDGSLVTHLTYNYGQKVVFKDFTELNHRSKAANIANLEYFLKDLTNNIQKKLLVQLLQQQFNDKFDDVYNYCYDGLKNIPLFLQESYNAKVTDMRNRSLLTFAENKFLQYIENQNSKHRYILISRSDPNGGQDQRDYLKVETRYSNSYKKKVVKHMSWLANQYRKGRCVSLCLTIDPRAYNYDKVRMWLEVKSDVIKFVDKTRRHLKRHGRVLPPYLCTIEAHSEPKSCGNPHIHMVFFGCNRLMDFRKVRKYWGKGHIQINRTRDNKKIRNPVAYVTKYITKTFTDTDADNCLTQSLVWLFNVKSYTCSQGLVVPLKPKSTGEWTADCFVTVDILESVFDEFALMDDRIYNLYGQGVDPH